MTIDVPSGISFQFERATQPYCVSNASGFEACADRANQDVADNLGIAMANRELRFKSANGQPGHLEIRLERNR